MRTYRAAWLLPIADDPVRDGWVAIEDGRIVEIGSHRDLVAQSGPYSELYATQAKAYQ